MNFNFNFKKNNLLIILLLILVILSCIVYFNMINVKEGLENINSLPKSRILYGSYLTEVTPSSADPSYSYYKLKYQDAKTIKLTSGTTGLTVYPDFSINEVLYTPINTITDTSFINSHKNYGMFGISDLSNVKFYHYISVNSGLTIDVDISSSTGANNTNKFNMLFKEFSGNIYEPSSNVHLTNLNVNIRTSESIYKKPLIVNGKFMTTPIPNETPPVNTQIQTASGGTATATGGNVTIGDTTLQLGSLRSLFGQGDPNLDSELFAYLLQNGTLGSSYVPPIYNNFETAMNLPSNPIANPVNSMNPLDYAQTLFGPNITPLMAKNSYLNQSDATTLDGNSSTLEGSGNTMKNIKSQTPNFDNNGNLLAQNSAGNASNNTNTNTINTGKNISKEDFPPCPAPQRCPEPNFECKKMPKYEQGVDNAFLPRPVLTDFSTFGM